MNLTPTELDRLTIFTVAELARRRRARGIRLNHPEAAALITDEAMEVARAGGSYQDVIETAVAQLTEADVMDGVRELVAGLRFEVLLEEGTRLVVLGDPIGGMA
jgi:urease gamma subunit